LIGWKNWTRTLTRKQELNFSGQKSTKEKLYIKRGWEGQEGTDLIFFWYYTSLSRLKKKRRIAKQAAEKKNEIKINEESDFQEFEPSDFDLSAGEYEEANLDYEATSLLNIARDNTDNDFTDTSDWEDYVNKGIVVSSVENKPDITEDDGDKLLISSSDVKDVPEGKPSVGG
jgi:hypothetical protein